MPNVGLVTVVKRESLPDYRYSLEVTTKGMKVTCRVIELHGSFEITREILPIDKSRHQWWKLVETFRELAYDKYQLADDGHLSKNVNKSGSV